MARQWILGLPIGKKRRRSPHVAKGAGLAAAILAPAVAVPVARKVGKVTRGAGHLVQRTRDAGGQLSEVLDTASDVKDSLSNHATSVGKVGAAVKAVAGGSGGGGGAPKLCHLIEEHADIAAPRPVVYNQWTQFEMFPTLVKGVESVDQQADDKAAWTAKIGPSRRTWTGRIVQQIPDERIAWESDGGVQLKGVVTFHSLDVDLTRVLVQMEYRPSGPVEWVGNTLRVQRRRVRRDLRLFKHFVELRGEETGAGRGSIGPDAEDSSSHAGSRNGRQGRQASGRGSAAAKRASQPSGSGRRPPSTGGRRSEGNTRRASPGNGRQAGGQPARSSA